MIRRVWSEQGRVTFWAWLATLGAAVMIAPLVEKKTYLWHGALGAAVVVAVGAALRARRVPWPVILLAQVAALAQWCVMVYARSEALLGVVPTRDAFAAIGTRVGEFFELTQRYAAPVPDDRDLTITLAIFVMVLALVVDAVAVTWRRVPLLGLIFLAIYMAPVALLGGEVSLFVFLPGAAGFVFLLAADERERLTHWGRQISAAGSVWEDPADEVNSGGIATTGRRIGLGAVAAAVVLPVVLPALSPHYFGESGSGGEDGSGSGDRTQVTNPVLDLKRNLTEQSDSILVAFSTDQPSPGYLRLASLDSFTGELWTPGERPSSSSVTSDSSLPSAPGLGSTVPRTGYRYDVDIPDDLESIWLPLVYAPTSIESDQRWSVDETSLDATALEEDQTTAGISYSFSALLAEPTPQLLRAARPAPVLSAFTALPPGLPSVIAEQARLVTAGAATPFDQALALQSWFRSRGGFRYSLETAPGTGMETISSFLTDNRVGYCEQFASAMALMARSLDIPARVAVGFLRPTPIGPGEYVYRGTDMHTWPELYFEGVGWVRFEPTPATRTGAAPDFNSGGSGPTKSDGVGPTGATRPSDVPSLPEKTPEQGAAAASDGSGPWRMVGTGIGVSVLVLLLAAAPRLLRALRSRGRWNQARRPVEVAEAAWAELRDGILDLRMNWDPALTPRGIGRQLRAQVTGDESFVRALNRIVLATEQGRYARQVRDAGALRQAVDTVVAVLAATRSPRLRWSATWLPASLVNRRRAPRLDPEGHRAGGALLSVAE